VVPVLCGPMWISRAGGVRPAFGFLISPPILGHARSSGLVGQL
jgi:hypothetical protein